MVLNPSSNFDLETAKHFLVSKKIFEDRVYYQTGLHSKSLRRSYLDTIFWLLVKDFFYSSEAMLT